MDRINTDRSLFRVDLSRYVRSRCLTLGGYSFVALMG